MKLEIDNIITIDNQDFYVADKIIKNESEYAFLLKTNEAEELSAEFDIVLVNNDNTISEIETDELYNSLQLEFIGKMKSENL